MWAKTRRGVSARIKKVCQVLFSISWLMRALLLLLLPAQGMHEPVHLLHLVLCNLKARMPLCTAPTRLGPH